MKLLLSDSGGGGNWRCDRPWGHPLSLEFWAKDSAIRRHSLAWWRGALELLLGYRPHVALSGAMDDDAEDAALLPLKRFEEVSPEDMALCFASLWHAILGETYPAHHYSPPFEVFEAIPRVRCAC
jgi:hypothetical protein